MVQEICADIKKLDYAKTHLQSTITSLKRLQMLITAAGQLEVIKFNILTTIFHVLYFLIYSLWLQINNFEK